MVKMRYLGPGHTCSMKLRRAFVDLRDEADNCRPLGDEYNTILALMRQIDETHQKLFGRVVADPAPHHTTPPLDARNPRSEDRGLAAFAGGATTPGDQLPAACLDRS